MHPPLTLENHPLCRDVVIALKVCHRENPWGRSFGACNEQKWALDACLKEQKLFKFRENNKKATGGEGAPARARGEVRPQHREREVHGVRQHAGRAR